ncbi:hypothetical protein HA466_0192380 [Hirschfeldia incana]|nr:hypothetical protein HA466_0192380 [Hirschfeldia incana]
MSPKIRSIFAQVQRKSVSMGSRRNFSSTAGDMKASSESYVAGFEMANKFSFVSSVKLGIFAWGSLEVYKIYKNYYPKLLICQEEYRSRVRRQDELFEQVQRDRDI